MKYHKELNRENLTPRQALEVLIEGNRRFMNDISANRTTIQAVMETRANQFPFAAILACSDSRVPPELVFDQGLGDLFTVRLAGNVAAVKAIASLEYACKYLGSKLIVVLGHTRCGGVIGACDDVIGALNGEDIGNLDAVFSYIRPAVEAEKTTKENRTSANAQFVNNVIHLNVEHQMKNIIISSPIIHKMLQEEKIGVVGGYYDIDNGMVTFYEEDRLFCLDSQFSSIQERLANA